MKLDKETALKHHFWGLLCLAVPLVIVCLFVLLTVVSAQIRKHRVELEATHKSVNAPGGNYRNEKWVEGMRKAADDKKKEEEVVWNKAYNAQATFFTWPVDFEKKFHFQGGFFPITIKVYRKPPADKTGSDDAKPPLYRLRGKVTHHDEEKFVVSYEKKVDKKTVPMPPAVFYRTPEIFNKSTKKITTDDNKELNFRDLQDGDWVDVTFEKGKYFGDPLTETEQEEFGATYASQIDPILAQVKPVTASGEGIVQLPGWFYKPGELPPAGSRFFRYVSKEWQVNKNVSEEAWIAQEDLWIQRELYRLVRLANDYVSIFKGEGGGDPKQWQTFTNPYWEIKLKLAGPKQLQVKITNLLPRRQKLDLPFLVRLHEPAADQPPFRIMIGGRDPLNPGEFYEPSFDLDKIAKPPTGIYGVEQVINWETAAVKRIDHVSIGSMSGGDCCHSDRTYPVGLQPFKKVAIKGGAKPAGGGVAGGGKMPVGKPGGEMEGGGDKGGGTTPHGLHVARYSDVTKQSRQLPVGMALIVDQDHIDRVLLAFTNSPLRFLTTQVIMNRYPRSLRPTLNLIAGRSGGTATDGNEGEQGGDNKFGRMKMSGFGSSRFGGGPLGGAPTQSNLSAGESSESNMELVIYGIATVYERYPPRKGP